MSTEYLIVANNGRPINGKSYMEPKSMTDDFLAGLLFYVYLVTSYSRTRDEKRYLRVYETTMSPRGEQVHLISPTLLVPSYIVEEILIIGGQEKVIPYPVKREKYTAYLQSTTRDMLVTFSSLDFLRGFRFGADVLKEIVPPESLIIKAWLGKKEIDLDRFDL